MMQATKNRPRHDPQVHLEADDGAHAVVLAEVEAVVGYRAPRTYVGALHCNAVPTA